MPYIHKLSDWPDFRWDAAAVTAALAAVRHKQGRQLGRMQAMGSQLQTEARLTALTSDVVKSSAIEGEVLSTGEVRSSIMRRLGLDTGELPSPSRDVDGIVEMMMDATHNYEQPLSKERLYAWHAALFPSGRTGMRRILVGAWRDGQDGPMRVISGPIGKERVHFEAPDADRLEMEMQAFLAWFNGAPLATDPVLKAAVAHLWFITIHPFADGNGRIARAITDLALARADGSKSRFYSMSAQVEAERHDYYVQLESAQRGSLDVTAWLVWFLACLDRSLDAAGGMLQQVLRKARIWQQIDHGGVNDRQRLVINRLLDDWHGAMNTSKYAALAKCSRDTALRDIQDLTARGIFVQNEAGGRSTSYRLADPADPQ